MASTKSNRGALTRSARRRRLNSDCAKLKEYLGDLPPFVRKYVAARQHFTYEDWRKLYLEPVVRQTCERANREYLAIARRIPEVWRKYLAQEAQAIRRLHEQASEVRRGAEEKVTEDMLTLRAVLEAEARLRSGCDLRKQRKAQGGTASGDQEIKVELIDLGYDDQSARAILRTRGAFTAACRLVATQTGREPTSVKVAAYRARRAATTPKK